MDGRRRAERIDGIGRQSVSPPLGFAVYGLAASWGGQRWLESVDGEYPASAVWLGHASGDGRGMLMGTLPSSYLAKTHSPATELAAAIAATDRLINVIAPDPSIPRPAGLGDAVVAYVRQRAGELSSWDTVGWQLEGELIQSRVWRFAAAWAGVAEVPHGPYLTAVGVGIGPAMLDLAPVGDGAVYGLDLSRSLTIADIRGSRTGMAMPCPNRRRVHEDLLALLP